MLGEDQLRERFTAIYRDKGAESIDTAALGLKLMLDEFRGDELPEDDRAFLLARRPVLDAP
jgi:sigma-B regulation protein RsbU (phosphoserine phosphatase)